jgi:pyruvate ferredoxin oxidoreductase delta subunit
VAKETGIKSWKKLDLGISILVPGSASALKTGDWRSMCPVVDYNTCIKCGKCYIYCPDMVYSRTEDGFYEPNYYYCKGCGICANECPVNAIKMVEEGD